VVKRARVLGLSHLGDVEVREVALAWNPPLTVVTSDRDFKNAALRAGAAVLFFTSAPDRARADLGTHFATVIQLLEAGTRLVTVPPSSPPAQRATFGAR
jgi:predicted nuclease of predicted toxin-antitoxin system